MELKAKISDTTESGLMMNSQSNEGLKATGKFLIECYDKDGKLKWTDESKNLVVNVGLQFMANSLFAVTTISAWYLGLVGSSATNSFNATDTMASHPAAGSSGWTEVTAYSEANRPTATFVAATTANPSVVTNSASKAQFTMNNTVTVGGAFLTSNNTKGGTSGTLFSGSLFSSPGNRNVVSGDVVLVTYTFSLAG